MSMFTAFNISASGMTAQQLRLDVVAENVTNSTTTRTEGPRSGAVLKWRRSGAFWRERNSWWKR